MRWLGLGLVGAAAVVAVGVCALYIYGMLGFEWVVASVTLVALALVLELALVEWGPARARSALRRSERRARLEQRYGPLEDAPRSIDEAVRRAVLQSGELVREEEEARGVRQVSPSAPRIPGKRLEPLVPEVSSVTAAAVSPLDNPRESRVRTPAPRPVVTSKNLVQPVAQDVVVAPAELSDEARRLLARPSKSSAQLPIPVGVVAAQPGTRIFPASTGKKRPKRRPAEPPAPPRKRTVADLYRPAVTSRSVEPPVIESTEGVSHA